MTRERSQSPHTTHLPAHVSAHADLHDLAWAQATSFAQVAELSGRWARGELACLAGGGRAPERVLAAAPHLSPLAEWGLVVLDGQRGVDEGYRQTRAYVSLLVAQHDVGPLTAHGAAADLLVLTAPAGLPVTRWDDDETATWAYPENELIERMAAAVTATAAAEINLRSTALVIADPQWGRDDALWGALARFRADHHSTPPDAGTDAFSVSFRTDGARRTAADALDRWFQALLDEVREQVRPHRTMPQPCLVVLPARLDADDTPSPGPPSLLLRPLAAPLRIPDPTALELLWAELNRALRVATGRPEAYSLVVDPDAGAVVGWWPRWCPVHHSDSPVAWWQAGVGARDPSMLEGCEANLLGDLPPQDLALAPDGVGHVVFRLRKWGVEPPTAPVAC